MKDLDIHMDEKTRETYPKSKWKALAKNAIKKSALQCLTYENSLLKILKKFVLMN